MTKPTPGEAARCGCIWKNVPFDDGFLDDRTCDVHRPNWRDEKEDEYVPARADGVSDDY